MFYNVCITHRAGQSGLYFDILWDYCDNDKEYYKKLCVTHFLGNCMAVGSWNSIQTQILFLKNVLI